MRLKPILKTGVHGVNHVQRLRQHVKLLCYIASPIYKSETSCYPAYLIVSASRTQLVFNLIQHATEVF